MTLTAVNTAIVLDSTADFPDAQARFANMRDVPLYVRFGEDSLKDHVEISSSEFYERLAAATELPTTSQPTPQDFLTAYENLVTEGYERIYSIHLSAKLSGTFQSASLAATELGGDRIVLIDSETASLACAMLALAIQRRLARGTTATRSKGSLPVQARHRSDLHRRHARLSAEGRPDRPCAGPCGLDPPREADPRPWRTARSFPIARVRGRKRRSRNSRVCSRTRRGTKPDCGCRSTRECPDWVDVLIDFVTKARPHAEIELVETLGAVVGTHAGPGAVGFFWFQDDAVTLKNSFQNEALCRRDALCGPVRTRT